MHDKYATANRNGDPGCRGYLSAACEKALEPKRLWIIGLSYKTTPALFLGSNTGRLS
jgi:hypothetical protein